MLEKVYKQIENLARGVKTDLRHKGFVVPIENRDGSISVDLYTISKSKAGFYKITSNAGDVLVDHINLPQTAALLANSLALGRWVDDRLLNEDRQYGYSLFEELQAKHIIDKRRDWDRVDIMYTKMSLAKHRKTAAKQAIMNSFEKLRNVR
jgi:hypothetical protein